MCLTWWEREESPRMRHMLGYLSRTHAGRGRGPPTATLEEGKDPLSYAQVGWGKGLPRPPLLPCT